MIRMTVSAAPPMNPAIKPSSRPTPIPTKPAINPILSEFGVPRTSSVHRSRPCVSVPRRWAALGASRGVSRSDDGHLRIDEQRADDREREEHAQASPARRRAGA